MGTLATNLEQARELIGRVLTPSALTIMGQEFNTAYLTADELERNYFHPSTLRETSPGILRGLLETSLFNIRHNIGGAEVRTVPNAKNTSSHNELILAGQLRLSIARCHPWTQVPVHADFRQMRTLQNAQMLFPGMLDVPDVADGTMLNGYIVHLPSMRRSSMPHIMDIRFLTPDGLGEIATIDLKPYLGNAVGKSKVSVQEIEEIHDLAVLEEQKTN